MKFHAMSGYVGLFKVRPCSGFSGLVDLNMLGQFMPSKVVLLLVGSI
jgi:hypothetical protein